MAIRKHSPFNFQTIITTQQKSSYRIGKVNSQGCFASCKLLPLYSGDLGNRDTGPPSVKQRSMSPPLPFLPYLAQQVVWFPKAFSQRLWYERIGLCFQ